MTCKNSQLAVICENAELNIRIVLKWKILIRCYCREAPGSPEMKDLKKKKVPLVLNYGMCHQQNKDYYESIRHIDMALEIEPGKDSKD